MNLRSSLAPVFFFTLVAACSDSSTPGGASLAGGYSGKAGASTIYLCLNSDHTFGNGDMQSEATSEVGGTWTDAGSIAFKNKADGSGTVTLADGTLTLDIDTDCGSKCGSATLTPDAALACK